MKAVVALVSIIALLACSSPSNPAKAEPTVNKQIIDRYTRDIWPAMSAFNADHAQAGEAAKQFFSVVDPNLAGDQLNTLRSAAQGMGRQGEYDAQDQTSHYNDGLTLAHVDVQSVKNGVAALNVCYTYNHFWYVNADNTQHAPAASEATVQLAHVNNTWYLRSVTNDHVVASCPPSQA